MYLDPLASSPWLDSFRVRDNYGGGDTSTLRGDATSHLVGRYLLICPSWGMPGAVVPESKTKTHFWISQFHKLLCRIQARSLHALLDISKYLSILSFLMIFIHEEVLQVTSTYTKVTFACLPAFNMLFWIGICVTGRDSRSISLYQQNNSMKPLGAISTFANGTYIFWMLQAKPSLCSVIQHLSSAPDSFRFPKRISKSSCTYIRNIKTITCYRETSVATTPASSP